MAQRTTEVTGATDTAMAVWVRRCAACDRLDTDACFGSPELDTHGWWRCAGCLTTSYVLDRLPMP